MWKCDSRAAVQHSFRASSVCNKNTIPHLNRAVDIVGFRLYKQRHNQERFAGNLAAAVPSLPSWETFLSRCDFQHRTDSLDKPFGATFLRPCWHFVLLICTTNDRLWRDSSISYLSWFTILWPIFASFVQLHKCWRRLILEYSLLHQQYFSFVTQQTNIVFITVWSASTGRSNIVTQCSPFVPVIVRKNWFIDCFTNRWAMKSLSWYLGYQSVFGKINKR